MGKWVNGLLEGLVLEELASGGKVGWRRPLLIWCRIISPCIWRWRDTARKVFGMDSIANFGLRRRAEGCEGLFENNRSLLLLNLAFVSFYSLHNWRSQVWSLPPWLANGMVVGGRRTSRRLAWWQAWSSWGAPPLQTSLLTFCFRAGVHLPRHEDGHIGHLFRRRKTGGRLWVWGGIGGKNVLSIIAFQVLAATYEQGVLVPVLSKTFGPTFHYEELTSWDVERQPLMADPYECRWCQVTKFHLHQYGSHLHQHRFRFKDPNWSRVERGCFLRERWGITKN